MIPKSLRLTKSDFNTLQTKVIFRGDLFDIAIAKNKEKKFACVISKKRIKKAVDRNKVRRRIYSSIQELQPNIPYGVIIYPKAKSLESPYSQIQEEIRSVFATLIS